LLLAIDLRSVCVSMDYSYSYICSWFRYFSSRGVVAEPISELQTIGRSPSESTNSAKAAKSVIPVHCHTVDCAYNLHLLVEDYRPGYPQFSALIAADDSFFAFRSFRRLRARLLLLKQDKLSLLEHQLDQVDREETCPAFLGKSRCDRNQARLALMCQIETCLNEYGIIEDGPVVYQPTISLTKYRSASPENATSFELQACEAERCAKPAKLGRWVRLSLQRRDRVSRERSYQSRLLSG
jgi:hypothetical protein